MVKSVHDLLINQSQAIHSIKTSYSLKPNHQILPKSTAKENKESENCLGHAEDRSIKTTSIPLCMYDFLKTADLNIDCFVCLRLMPHALLSAVMWLSN